jgi:hypothetical protein
MRTRLIALAGVALLAALASLVVATAAAKRAVREALRAELQTVQLENCSLKRYGSAHDGGYLLCANLLAGAESAYSYGINTEDNWGCQVSRELHVPVHQYDCFTEHRPACDGGTFVFHDECVGPDTASVDGQPFDTLTRQIAANGDAGKRLLVKIDIEGAEWEALRATPDAVLARVDQLAMELHGTDEQRFLEVVRRLKHSFHLVNVNFNNWGCTPDAAPLPAWAYQVLWVNKRLGVLDPDAPSPAPRSPENAPDNPNGPDCQLP